MISIKCAKCELFRSRSSEILTKEKTETAIEGNRLVRCYMRYVASQTEEAKQAAA